MTSFFGTVGIICQPTTKQQNLYLTTARSKPCFFRNQEKQKKQMLHLPPKDVASYCRKMLHLIFLFILCIATTIPYSHQYYPRSKPSV